MITNSSDTNKRIFIIFRREHWKLFNIRSSRHQFYSQRWIIRWSFVEQLYQLTFLQSTSWFLQKKYFLSFWTKAIFLLLSLGQRRSLNITPRKWYLTETFSKNLKNLNFALFWGNFWLKQNNWWPIFTASFFSSKVPVHCRSVENVFWNFVQNALENTRNRILQLW